MLAFDDPFGVSAGGLPVGFFETGSGGYAPADWSGWNSGGSMGWDVGGMDITMPNVQLPETIDLSGIFRDVTGTGGGGTREQAVSLVNSAEVVLQRNMDDYRAGNLSASSCAERFDAVWTQLVNRLQSLGSEGARAIADRQAGGKFDWFAAYRPAGIPLTRGTPGGERIITSDVGGGLSSANMKMIILIAALGLVVWIVATRLPRS